MAFSVTTDLEPGCQFLYGFPAESLEGRIKAPAAGSWATNGYFVKVDSTGTYWELCGSNDATHITEQPVGTGPIASAANREKYLLGFPQDVVANGQELSAYPADGGKTIRTKVVVTGTDTGALTTSTAIKTQVEAYNGKLREVQGANTPIGEVLQKMDSDGYIEIYLY